MATSLIRAVLDREGVLGRAGAAAAAADQGHLNRVVFGRIDARDGNPRQGRDGRDSARMLEKLTTRA